MRLLENIIVAILVSFFFFNRMVKKKKSVTLPSSHVASPTARSSRRCQIAAGARSKPQHSLFLWFRDQPRQPTQHDPPQPSPVVWRQPQRQGPPRLHAAHEMLSPSTGNPIPPAHVLVQIYSAVVHYLSIYYIHIILTGP